MGMFAHSIDCEPFGTLTAEGQSRIWEGEVEIARLGGLFSVRVWGDRSGPTDRQVAAFTTLMQCAASIREKSAGAAACFLKQADIVPPNVEITPQNVWAYANPCFIEVHADEVYCANAGQPGQIAISVGYEVPWDDGHLLQIGTIDGVFDQVYSE